MHSHIYKSMGEYDETNPERIIDQLQHVVQK